MVNFSDRFQRLLNWIEPSRAENQQQQRQREQQQIESDQQQLFNLDRSNTHLLLEDSLVQLVSSDTNRTNSLTRGQVDTTQQPTTSLTFPNTNSSSNHLQQQQQQQQSQPQPQQQPINQNLLNLTTSNNRIYVDLANNCNINEFLDESTNTNNRTSTSSLSLSSSSQLYRFAGIGPQESFSSSIESEPTSSFTNQASSTMPSPFLTQSQPNSNYNLTFSFANSSSNNNHQNNNTNNNINNLSSSSSSGRQNSRRNRRRHRSSRHHSNHSNYQIQSIASNSSSSSSSTSLQFFSNSKKNERNLLSASCAVFCIAILAVSLVETRWFYLNGGGCNVNYIGVAHFFAPGRLEYQIETSKVTKNDITVYSFILPNGLVLKNCANREIMLIMRTVIAFVFLAIFSSSIGLMLDTFGCMKPGIRLIRRHGIFHILTVVFCLIINGFCFWISEKMNDQQNDTRLKKGKKVDVLFDVSYYLIVLASGLSILATAFTLIRRYPTDEDEQLERLLEEYTGFEEPIHLERSLPANVPVMSVHSQQQVQSQSPHHNFFIINNSNESANQQHQQQQQLIETNIRSGQYPFLAQQQQQQQSNQQYQHAPPPPATPPPSLHLNNINEQNSSSLSAGVVILQNNNLNEPPPPYDPTPVIA